MYEALLEHLKNWGREKATAVVLKLDGWRSQAMLTSRASTEVFQVQGVSNV